MTKRHEFVVYLSSTLDDLEPEREVALKTFAEFAPRRNELSRQRKGRCHDVHR
jgi:hypothetical protein